MASSTFKFKFVNLYVLKYIHIYYQNVTVKQWSWVLIDSGQVLFGAGIDMSSLDSSRLFLCQKQLTSLRVSFPNSHLSEKHYLQEYRPLLLDAKMSPSYALSSKIFQA